MPPRRVVSPAALLLISAVCRAALPTPDPDDGAIRLPPGFRALVVADNLVAGRQFEGNAEHLRFLAVAENGDIYGKLNRNGLVALRDTTGDGRADRIEEFGSGPGTGVAVHGAWLYYSTRTGVYRYAYVPGQLVPPGAPQTIVEGLPAGPQHDAKAFAFDGQGRLLVETGSPFNVYSEGDRQFGARGLDPTEFLKTHGGFWLYDPNRPNQTQADAIHYSTGHRHSIALAWNPVSRAFFMVMMGRDNLNLVDPKDYSDYDNAARVAEEMHELHPGANLGWPYTYYDPLRHARMIAPEFGGDNRKRAAPGIYDEPVIAFPAHWAPLQMTFYFGHQFPARYHGGAFIAFHGSWNRAPLPQGGYNVVFVPFDATGHPTGKFEIFADGFSGIRGPFTRVADARFRPGGVAVGPDGSLYIGDTEKGRIWRVIYTGESRPGAETVNPNPPSDAQPPPAPSPASDQSPGARFYAQVCAACHMSDGSGVPGMTPALKDDPVVAGDPTRMIAVVLRGPAAVLPADRPHFGNVMPPFGSLDDATLAAVIGYVRQRFGHAPSPVLPADIAAVRSGKALPPPAMAAPAKTLLESSDVRLTFADGRVRLERSGSLLAEVRSFDFNFTAPQAVSAEVVTDAQAILHLVYPETASYGEAKGGLAVDVLIDKVNGGFRFHAKPTWATSADVQMTDLGEHFFGVLERLYPGNRRSPDLRGQVVDVEAVGGASRYHENWASVWSAFFMTDRGYASFFDTFASGRYRLGLNGTTELHHDTGQLDWYLFPGLNGDEILTAYYRIIGAPKLPPLWSLGPIGWRDRNKGGAAEILDDVRRLTALRAPFTAWWADRPYSDGASGWSKMNFNSLFKNPARWIGALRHDYDLRVMTWVGPLVFEDRDFPGRFDVPPGYFDLSDPSAVAEWGRRLARLQYAFGIQGHKMDRADEDLPLTAPWSDGTDAESRQNKYLYLYAKVVSDALEKAWGPDQFNFARAAYQRTQPNLSAVWGGDSRSTWDGLGSELACAIRCGFMGFPMWGSDTGGYLGGRIDEELYARWLEFGQWSGLFEIKLDDDDGVGPDRPPWVYGPRLQAAFREACQERMRLLPYLYSLARTSARNGVMMKPLAYVWPGDPATYAVADEYLLGPAILVAPLTAPGGRRSVYLPAGLWYDFYDATRRFRGGRSITVDSPFDRIPVFVRGNSIYVTGTVPIGSQRRWETGASPALEVTATPGAAGDYTAFEFVDLFDHDRSKVIGLAASDGLIEVTAPPLGAPARIRVVAGGALRAENGGRAIAIAREGPFAVIGIPSGVPVQLRIYRPDAEH